MKDIKQLSQQQGVTTTVLCDAVALSRATYYRHQQQEKKETVYSPSNALNRAEKQRLLDTLHDEEYVDMTPYQVYYSLLDKGMYLGSIRTMYRLLQEQGESIDRREQRCHRNAVKPELIAQQPNEVWTWDITKLLSTQRLTYYYLYVILDIYSRYVVGWMLANNECQHLAKKLIQTTALKQGIQPGRLTLHADNGPSMTSITVAQLLDHLGVTKSHNRPYTSNDNPFSESQFKTLKYHPMFPKKFDCFNEAELFCQQFFSWYNNKHYHSGIAYLTPESVHHGKYYDVLMNRHQVLLNAFKDNPIRFNNRQPEIKSLKPAYINPPQSIEIGALQQGEMMAK